jgi:hypothetical protein
VKKLKKKFPGNVSGPARKKSPAKDKVRADPEISSNPPREASMADAPKTQDRDAAGAAGPGARPATENRSLGIRLMPVENSDQPVVANYTSLNVSPGMVFVDFGFLEPAMLTALPRVARSGGKLPERLNGRLAVRVAMGYDAVANLHQQLGQVLRGLGQAQARAASPKKDA